MKAARTIKSVRNLVQAARTRGKEIGFVPTMGALHAGHLFLVKAAKRKCDFVVVSIFVNPTQFGPTEDFRKYPRPLKADLRLCKKAGVDLVFAPTAKEMYSSENLTWVDVEKLTELLCGRFRPGHFRGVATVCAKLFNIVLPDFAFFGQKDAQQAIVIRRMVADLNMPLKIVICPTIREKSGLALSSRNQYLTARQKQDATAIYKSLHKCRQLIKSGIRDSSSLKIQMKKILNRVPFLKIQYIGFVDAETLRDLKQVTGKALIAVAVELGQTRLIDNIIVDVTGK